MSLDISLKGQSSLTRHRNVLKRSERIAMLEDDEKWTEGKNSVFNIVKVGHRKLVGAKKAAKTEAGAEGAAAAPAAGGKATPAGKAAPAAKAAPAKK
jgi:small basic protein (TIGR04137 family)